LGSSVSARGNPAVRSKLRTDRTVASALARSLYSTALVLRISARSGAFS
jgi:hypothetical protein